VTQRAPEFKVLAFQTKFSKMKHGALIFYVYDLGKFTAERKKIILFRRAMASDLFSLDGVTNR